MEIANRRETFVYSGSGMNRADTGGNIPDMFLRAERGIHCENQRRWMSFFDVCKYGFEIQRMNRRIQCSVNMDIFPAMSGKLLTDQRTKTVACDPSLPMQRMIISFQGRSICPMHFFST